MSQNYIYTVQSVQTGYYITSASDDHRNQNINTVDGESGIPAGATTPQTLTFNKALESGNNTDVTIKGISGLYAAAVDMTSPGVYVIIPKGPDAYWVTNETRSHITLRAGKDVVENENQWYIKKVD